MSTVSEIGRNCIVGNSWLFLWLEKYNELTGRKNTVAGHSATLKHWMMEYLNDEKIDFLTA